MGVVLEPTHDRAPAAAAAPTRFPHCDTGVVISPDTSGVHSFHQKRTRPGPIIQCARAPAGARARRAEARGILKIRTNRWLNTRFRMSEGSAGGEPRGGNRLMRSEVREQSASVRPAPPKRKLRRRARLFGMAVTYRRKLRLVERERAPQKPHPGAGRMCENCGCSAAAPAARSSARIDAGAGRRREARTANGNFPKCCSNCMICNTSPPKPRNRQGCSWPARHSAIIDLRARFCCFALLVESDAYRYE